jgi:hypothetical protein
MPHRAASKIAVRSACSSQMKRLSPTARSGRGSMPGGKALQPAISAAAMISASADLADPVRALCGGGDRALEQGVGVDHRCAVQAIG